MNLFGRTNKSIKKKNENVPSLEVVEVGLVQCNLVDNQYQQKSKILYTLKSSKSYAYLSSVEQSNLVFLKTCNADFDEIIIIFTDENGRLLEKKIKQI